MEIETKNAETLDIICPLCESHNNRPRPGYQHIPPGDWSLYQCAHCGTSFIYPQPEPEILKEFYDQDYYGSGEGKFLGSVEVIVRFVRFSRARVIQGLTPPGASVLDVGCGRGLMLKYLKDRGYKVDAVELDTAAAARARSNLNQLVYRTLEELARIDRQQYRTVCFWHSLEHLHRPGRGLRIADQLLAPGGLLVISAPHMESLQSRLSGTSWLHLDLPRHLAHFDMNRLASFLQARGYEMIGHRHVSFEYNVIDTLCYLYAVLGFHHLYPFNLIRGTHADEASRGFHSLKTITGLSLLLPLTSAAFFIASTFSLLKSGSTTTIFLRKAVK